MRNLVFLMLLVPLLVISQTTDEYMVFENATITVHPSKVADFEKGVAAHNKKFHTDEIYGARVYWVSNGKNVGKYIWAMGPLPWSAMDGRPAQEGHDEDWQNNVLPYMELDADQTYWRFHPDKSNFPNAFDLKNLWVRTFDMKRFTGEKSDKLLAMIHKTMVEKMGDETFGVYSNEFPSMTDKKDIAFVNFFSNSGWIGEDGKFAEKFNEVHGEGSFANFLKEWEAITHGTSTNEIWVYREDLSGLGPAVDVAARQ